MVAVGGADKGKILFVGDREDDPAVFALKEIGLVVVIELAGHDMAAAHQPHPFAAVESGHVTHDFAHPGPADIDQHFRSPGFGFAGVGIGQVDVPQAGLSPGTGDPGAGQDLGAVCGGIPCVQRHQPGVIDPAIAVFVGVLERVVKRGAFRAMGQVQTDGARKDFPAPEVVIQEQPEPDQPGRATPLFPGHDQPEQIRGGRAGLELHILVIGQDEPHRPCDMRHRPEQDFPLFQRLSHKAQLEIFQIPKTAVEELGRGTRGCRGEVIHLGQRNVEAAPGGVTGNAAAVDPATDDEDIVGVLTLCVAQTPASCWLSH